MDIFALCAVSCHPKGLNKGYNSISIISLVALVTGLSEGVTLNLNYDLSFSFLFHVMLEKQICICISTILHFKKIYRLGIVFCLTSSEHIKIFYELGY